MSIFPDFLTWPQGGFLVVSGLLVGAAILGLLFGNGHGSKVSAKLYSEKRRMGRRPSHLVFEFEHGLGYVPTRGRLMNVSTKGACFYSSFSLKRGEWVHGHLHSPKKNPINISGQIVWLKHHSRGILYGIHFDRAIPFV